MVVLAAEDVDVERDAGALRKRLEDVRDHLAREVADLFALELQVAAEVRARRDVEDGAREGLRWAVRPTAGQRTAPPREQPREQGKLERGEQRTSSSGAKPVPYRRIPRRSPSASLNASPSAIAQSSAVWWSSIHRSPLHWSESDILPCLASAESICCGSCRQLLCATPAGSEGGTHVVKEANARVDVDDLLGARLMVEREGHGDVGLARLARDGRRADLVRAVRSHRASALLQAVRLKGARGKEGEPSLEFALVGAR